MSPKPELVVTIPWERIDQMARDIAAEYGITEEEAVAAVRAAWKRVPPEQPTQGGSHHG